MRFLSDSSGSTEKFAERLSQLLKGGDFISLQGELGAGKTKFAGGVAKGLGVDPSLPVTSPTYTLLNIYQGRLPLYHFDLYRLSGDDDVVALGFPEYFHDKGICLVEWADRLHDELPRDRLEIRLSYLTDECREIELISFSERFDHLLEQLSAEADKILS
jgi:tRNA threonylcarbamoyladenosine biosynthesis protein TsaE